MRNEQQRIQGELNGWPEKEAFVRAALDGLMPPDGVDWVVSDFKRRWDSCPEVQSIKGIFDALQQGDPESIRAAILDVVQEAIAPWAMCAISLERDLYHTLAAANCSGRA